MAVQYDLPARDEGPPFDGLVIADAEVEATLLRFRMLLSQHPQRRMVVCDLQGRDDTTTVIDAACQSIATAAAALWPHWYGDHVRLPAHIASREDQDATGRALNEVFETCPGVAASWLRSAVQACQCDRTPWGPQLERGLQLNQLTRAISPEGELLLLLVARRPLTHESLPSVADAIAWLAGVGRICVRLVLPPLWSQLHNATLADVKSWRGIGAAEPQQVRGVAHSIGGRERLDIVWPVMGRPHPGSPGEMRLAELLSASSDLCGRFEFNVLVPTAEEPYLVDLRCDDQRLIIEVDGYSFHSSPAAFAEDRRRDFLLSEAGYTVLRLPHDLIIDDPTEALTRIRRLLALKP